MLLVIFADFVYRLNIFIIRLLNLFFLHSDLIISQMFVKFNAFNYQKDV